MTACEDDCTATHPARYASKCPDADPGSLSEIASSKALDVREVSVTRTCIRSPRHEAGAQALLDPRGELPRVGRACRGRRSAHGQLRQAPHPRASKCLHRRLAPAASARGEAERSRGARGSEMRRGRRGAQIREAGESDALAACLGRPSGLGLTGALCVVFALAVEAELPLPQHTGTST